MAAAGVGKVAAVAVAVFPVWGAAGVDCVPADGFPAYGCGGMSRQAVVYSGYT